MKCKHLSHNLPSTLESLRSYEIKTKAFPVSLFNSNTVTLNEKHVSLSAKRSLLNTSTGCHLCETYSRNVTGYCATVFSESTQSDIKSLLNKNLRTETMFSRQVKIWAGTFKAPFVSIWKRMCDLSVSSFTQAEVWKQRRLEEVLCLMEKKKKTLYEICSILHCFHTVQPLKCVL